MRTEQDYERIAAAIYPRTERPRNIQVYLCYDGTGALIYIGRTDQWARRKAQHKRLSKWWWRVVRIEFRYFETYGDSLVAEAVLIRDERPRFNVAGITK